MVPVARTADIQRTSRNEKTLENRLKSRVHRWSVPELEVDVSCEGFQIESRQ